MGDPHYPHAVAISFPYAEGRVAAIVLLRSAELGPFTDHERTLLGVAREIGEECLPLGITTSMPSAAPKSALSRRTAPAMFVLDRAYQVVMGPRAHGPSPAAPDGARERLPRLIEQEVRTMTSAWAADPRTFVNATSVSLPLLVIRAHSMHGRDGAFLAVTVESLRVRQVLRRASEAYTITARELEVLAALLDGLRTEEIAAHLAISISTVNDHVKSLVARTKSQNRSQMLARILGWYGAEPTSNREA
ncbi:hypothetical protein WPS_25470 [Vulcanimicrobium alpinum]|uniref:HTH luxR-type domain-containing protein n=1 Tax=Vulcanimicrobium alpinum TaxID=3016050 RepID=A0AAN2CAM6_UNVUL|nr:helix-turn-helix transcriptional regulator [Vulcanimicrobium alpinum]BDE07271.1 hypothetical protein WPS_25470 [Vulcanimicrobium alpinum]